MELQASASAVSVQQPQESAQPRLMSSVRIDRRIIQMIIESHLRQAKPKDAERILAALRTDRGLLMVQQAVLEGCALSVFALAAPAEKFSAALAECRPLNELWARQLRADVFRQSLLDGALEDDALDQEILSVRLTQALRRLLPMVQQGE